MLKRLPSWLRKLSLWDQRGQVIVIFAVMLPTLIGLSAGGVDVGSWYVKNHQARSVADAAALAGAMQLGAGVGGATSCVNGPAATTAATNSFNTNKSKLGPDASIQILPCYDPSSEGITGVTAPQYYFVKVIVTTTAPAYLAKILGFGSVNVAASAIAARAASTAQEGIFANGGPSNPDTPGVGCGKEESGFYLNGNNASIGGALVSNGTFQVIGSGNTAAAGTYYNAGPGTGCVPSIAAGNSFAGQPQPATDPQFEPFPYNFACSYKDGTHCVDQFSCSQYVSNPAGAPSWVHYPPPDNSHPPKFWQVPTWTITGTTRDAHGTLVVSGGQLSPGIYCNTALAGGCKGGAECIIKIANQVNNGVRCASSPCNVTFVADKIELYQQHAEYTPYENNVVAFGVPKPNDCTANHEIHFSADDAGWTGILYAPCGDIEFGQGASGCTDCADDDKAVDDVHCTACVIEGRYVEILGDRFTMTATGPPHPAGSALLAK